MPCTKVAVKNREITGLGSPVKVHPLLLARFLTLLSRPGSRRQGLPGAHGFERKSVEKKLASRRELLEENQFQDKCPERLRPELAK